MGAAKRRGSLEERIRQSQARHEEALGLFIAARRTLAQAKLALAGPERDRLMAEGVDKQQQALRLCHVHNLNPKAVVAARHDTPKAA